MHQLSSLVDDLLDIARISRGKIVLHRQRLAVSLIIERACETSRPLIEARKHQLDVKLPDAPLYVEGDLLRLAQVAANLLGNAAKYTDDGGCISVTVERVDDEVCISVRDNGSGIAPEMLPQVFDLFSQANPTIDRSQGGLGIGLTLVQRLVQLHGGRVEARSAGLGQGSEFIVRLPLLKVEKSETSPPIPASGPQSRPALRILVVDDNVDAAESMSMLLEMEGHEVRIALDGEVALKAAEVFHPHVVVLDIGLPGMDGYEVARQLRSRHATSECLLIALTGYGQPEDAYRAKVAGFDHHLVKPVEPRALTTLITAQAAKMQHTAEPYAPAPAE